LHSSKVAGKLLILQLDNSSREIRKKADEFDERLPLKL
jgi:hypothetical protein